MNPPLHSRVFDTRTIQPEFCLVVDVFHEGVHYAPRGRKRLGIELESACRQIAIHWRPSARGRHDDGPATAR